MTNNQIKIQNLCTSSLKKKSSFTIDTKRYKIDNYSIL